jgi:hypothetical protein
MPSAYTPNPQHPGYAWPYHMPYMYPTPGMEGNYNYPKPPFVFPGYPHQPVADAYLNEAKEKEKPSGSSRERSREKSLDKSIKSVSSTSKKTK